jgi:arylsulfatase A-like enzyme
VAAGSTCDVPVISADLYPTLLEMAGLSVPRAQKVDGVSYASPLLAKGGIAERPLFWHYPHYSNQGGRPAGAVLVGGYKLVDFFEDHHVELYRLAEDEGELKDLASAEPARAEEMRKLLADWRRDVGAQMPTPNPDPVDPFGPKGQPPKK